MTDELRVLWDRLLAEEPVRDVAASSLGLVALRSPQIIVAQRDGVPVGLIAVTRAAAGSWKQRLARRLVSAGDVHWQCRYPIVGHDVASSTDALLRELQSALPWEELVLGPMLVDSPVFRAIQTIGEKLGMRPLVVPHSGAPRVVITDTWEAYYASRSHNLRRDISRGERTLGKLGPLTLELVRGGARLDVALDAFFRTEATGWKLEERSAIACNPDLQRRYTALARDAASRGCFRAYLLRAGEAVVAASYCIEHEGDLFLMKTAYAAEFQKASPGHVMHKQVLAALWAERTCRAFDFETGDTHADYKARWATETRAYATVRLFRRWRIRSQLLAQVVHMRRALADSNTSQLRASRSESAPP